MRRTMKELIICKTKSVRNAVYSQFIIPMATVCAARTTVSVLFSTVDRKAAVLP